LRGIEDSKNLNTETRVKAQSLLPAFLRLYFCTELISLKNIILHTNALIRDLRAVYLDILSTSGYMKATCSELEDLLFPRNTELASDIETLIYIFRFSEEVNISSWQPCLFCRYHQEH